jgi:hypothetical protein
MIEGEVSSVEIAPGEDRANRLAEVGLNHYPNIVCLLFLATCILIPHSLWSGTSVMSCLRH